MQPQKASQKLRLIITPKLDAAYILKQKKLSPLDVYVS